MIALTSFRGMVPQVHPRLLPPEHAQHANNCRIESGVLMPVRRTALDHTFPSDTQSFVRHNGAWLGWNALVSAIPGPVATNRLYVFGDGAPKVMAGATTYPLAVPRPTSKPEVVRRTNLESLRINGTFITLKNGEQRGGSTWSYAVAVRAGIATVTITHSTGATPAATAAMLNGITYRNHNTALIPSLKILRITSTKDNGGQTLDAFRSRVGSDTRRLESIGSTIRVGGTEQTFDFGTPDVQDAENIADQNDPPTLALSGLNPTYAAGAGDVQVFSAAAVNTIEAGQGIIEVILTVEGLTNGILDSTQRVDFVYAYTFVTSLDEESAPSPLSSIVGWSPGQSVRLSGFAAAPSGRGINRMRIYRSETGASGQTDLYLIAERAFSTSNFDDAVDLLPIQEAIRSLTFDAPRAGLRGAVSMPNGMMAAFEGRDVWFCEPWQPHAWPAGYAQRVEHDIVGLAAFGTSLAVLTTAQPYLAQGMHPDQMRLTKIEGNFPCVSARSIVDMGYFAVYASTFGLVAISEAGPKLVTKDIVSRRAWFEMRPSTFVGSHHQDRYVAAHSDGAGGTVCTTFDLSIEPPNIVGLRATPQAFHNIAETGRLYYIHKDNMRQVREVDPVSGPDVGVLEWRSKQFIFNQATAYACMLVDADYNESRGQLAVKVIADGKTIAIASEANRIVWIPGGRLYRKWEIEIKTSMRITAVYLAHSPDEIMKAVGAAR